MLPDAQRFIWSTTTAPPLRALRENAVKEACHELRMQTQTLLDDAAVDAFLAAPAVGPVDRLGRARRRAAERNRPIRTAGTPTRSQLRRPAVGDAGAAAADAADASSGTKKKLSAAEREKARDEQMLRDARESIRKRGWSEGEVKWRAWLATRGHDVQVNDWNLHKYVDGECIPPSRDPFWLNANEKELPDYEAGNGGPNEDPEPPIKNLMGEVIGPKHAPPRILHLPELWADVRAGELEAAGLGRKVGARYMWRQTVQNVRLEVQVPPGTSARDLRVTMEPSRLAVQVGAGPPILDEELYMRIYVGSNTDDDVSIWEVQDRRVVVFHLTKWHRLAAGNVRDASRTWWPRAFVSEPAFQDLEGGDMVHPPHEYYNLKGKAGEI